MYSINLIFRNSYVIFNVRQFILYRAKIIVQKEFEKIRKRLPFTFPKYRISSLTIEKIKKNGYFLKYEEKYF